MKLANLLNFRKNTKTLSRRDTILKRITKFEELLDEQLPCKKKYNGASDDINVFMQKQVCKCAIEGIGGTLQCQYGCSCNYYRKTCSLDCGCEGMCIPNTFLHMPDLEVRIGIAGDELYTKEDIESGRLAFVFFGEMTSMEKYEKSLKEKQIDLYSIIGKWKGRGLFNIGKDGVPTFVINTHKEEAGFVNHSCDPNLEILEIWQNGKLYIVGKTMKYCFVGDCLTYDYNWAWPDDAIYSEICLCGSKNCRAFVAKVSSIVMHRSILHYEALLNEMETHNIYETQRLDRMQLALHTRLSLNTQEKMNVQHLKQDSEELCLTKCKAIYLKKGILLAKAKLAEVEVIENENKKTLVDEADYSSYQRLCESSDQIELDHPYEESFKTAEAKFSKFANRFQSNLSLPHSNDEAVSLFHSCKSNNSKFSKFVCQSPIEVDQDSNDEIGLVSIASRASTSSSFASALSRNSLKDESAIFQENSNKHCVSESRISQALRNDGLPLSVRVPLPIKDNDECVLMGIQDVDKLLTETKIKLKSSKSGHSFFGKSKCLSPSCLYPTKSPTIEGSFNTPYLNQYDSAMKTSLTSGLVEEMSELDLLKNVGIKKAKKEKEKVITCETTNFESKIKNPKFWGEGLFNQDEIHRIFSWVEGTILSQGERSQFQPWLETKEWAFWLHRNFRHPTPTELQNHKKTWIGMSTNTLRAGESGKATTSRTLPLVRDVRALLSDILTFVPYKFSGFNLVKSPKSGNIWCIVWNKVGEPLPGNPTFRIAG